MTGPEMLLKALGIDPTLMKASMEKTMHQIDFIDASLRRIEAKLDILEARFDTLEASRQTPRLVANEHTN